MSAITRCFARRRAAVLIFGFVAISALMMRPGSPAQAQDTDEEFLSIRQDARIFQLEEIAALLGKSLGRISDRIATLAINSIYYGTEVDNDFRRKAEVVILEELLEKNPTVKLVQCQECQRLETKIVRGILKLRKGIPSQEARIELAKKLGVDGFIDIGIFQDGGQLTMYIKVSEAETGAIILVDEMAGRRAPRRDSLTVYFGEVNFPIEISNTVTDHNTLVIGVQESVLLTGRWSFSVDLAFFLDNNDNNPDPHLTIDSGAFIAPSFAFDIWQIPASTSRILGYFGIGKLLSSQLDFANFIRGGLEAVIGDNLVVTLGIINFFDTSPIEGSTTTDEILLGGSGLELHFGYRF